METQLQAYLTAVGIVDGVTSHRVDCEVCGHADYEVVVEVVETVDGQFDRLPVVVCNRCGLFYQNPRFNEAFYQAYYERYYRQALFGTTQPQKDFVVDQVRRGEFLLRSLARYLPERGRMLDVGCSAGGNMVAFARRDWAVTGNDPDAAYAEFGRKQLRLKIDTVNAEDMCLPDANFDLIIIIGSLEHVYNVNRVLALCRKACVPDGLLLIEGRAFGYGVIKGYFSHNHRRYLTIASIEMLMLRHGWEPVVSTDGPLSGPTRPGAAYVLGRASAPMPLDTLIELIPIRWPDRRAHHMSLLSRMTGFVGDGVAPRTKADFIDE
jgi:SAM-dependent methyltransferase